MKPTTAVSRDTRATYTSAEREGGGGRGTCNACMQTYMYMDIRTCMRAHFKRNSQCAMETRTNMYAFKHVCIEPHTLSPKP